MHCHFWENHVKPGSEYEILPEALWNIVKRYWLNTIYFLPEINESTMKLKEIPI